jgi:4-diphosphocytidyl-2-C-methyl-D-erythritol kinase
LGSDCPFFIYNKPCFASGRGEHLLPINIDLSSFKIVLVNPSIHIDTFLAFSGTMPKHPVKSIKEIILQPMKTWKQELINDFEISVFKSYPEIKKIKETLYERGALYVSLTGSGSTVYGIFNNTDFINTDFPISYFSRIIDLR